MSDVGNVQPIDRDNPPTDEPGSTIKDAADELATRLQTLADTLAG